MSENLPNRLRDAEFQRRIQELELWVESAFPDADLIGHRKGHEAEMIERIAQRQNRRAYIEQIIRGIFFSGVVLTIVGVLTALFLWKK